MVTAGKQQNGATMARLETERAGFQPQPQNAATAKDCAARQKRDGDLKRSVH